MCIIVYKCVCVCVCMYLWDDWVGCEAFYFIGSQVNIHEFYTYT